MLTISGFILRGIERFWNNIRYFFYRHKTLFDILFTFGYAIEQGSLYLFLKLFPNSIEEIVTFFILLLLTTISVEKIFMESRYNYLKEKNRIITFKI